jgi:hypothetical protein
LFVLWVVSKDKRQECKTKKQVQMKYKQSTREYKQNAGGCEIFLSHPDWHGAHPASCTIGTGGKGGRVVALTTHPDLRPRLKKQ